MKHNRNIYTESGRSVSMQLLNFLMSSTHTYSYTEVWRPVFACGSIHLHTQRLKAHLVTAFAFVVAHVCAHASVSVCAVWVMTSASCCKAARQEQCVATGIIVSLNC